MQAILIAVAGRRRISRRKWRGAGRCDVRTVRGSRSSVGGSKGGSVSGSCPIQAAAHSSACRTPVPNHDSAARVVPSAARTSTRQAYRANDVSGAPP